MKAKTCTVVSRKHGQSSMTAARLHKPSPARTRCQREKKKTTQKQQIIKTQKEQITGRVRGSGVSFFTEL